MGNEGASAAHAAKETFGDAMKVFTKYFAPLAGIVGGYLSSALIGGGQAISNIVNQAFGQTYQGNSGNRIGAAIMAIILALAGYIFWGMRNGGGLWMPLLGGIVGGFLLGAGLGNVQYIVSGAQAPAGFIEQLAGGVQKVAGGG